MKEEPQLDIYQIEALNHQLEKAIKQAILTGRREDLEKAQVLKTQVESSLAQFKEKWPSIKRFTPVHRSFLESQGFIIKPHLPKPISYWLKNSDIELEFEDDFSKNYLLNQKPNPTEFAYSQKTLDLFNSKGQISITIPNNQNIGIKDFAISVGSVADYIDIIGQGLIHPERLKGLLMTFNPGFTSKYFLIASYPNDPKLYIHKFGKVSNLVIEDSNEIGTLPLILPKIIV